MRMRNGIILVYMEDGMKGRENSILHTIAKAHEQLSGGIINASLTSRIKEGISTLLNVNVLYCDMMISEDGENQYICKTDDDVLRVTINGNTLLIFSDTRQGLHSQYTLPEKQDTGETEPEERWNKNLERKNISYSGRRRRCSVPLQHSFSILFYIFFIPFRCILIQLLVHNLPSTGSLFHLFKDLYTPIYHLTVCFPAE